MRLRRRKEAEPILESGPTAHVALHSMISAIDGALAGARGRDFFTRDEAVQTLLDVQATANRVLAPNSAPLVNAALVNAFDTPIVDRQRVADALLDLRLFFTEWLSDPERCTLETASSIGE